MSQSRSSQTQGGDAVEQCILKASQDDSTEESREQLPPSVEDEASIPEQLKNPDAADRTEDLEQTHDEVNAEAEKKDLDINKENVSEAVNAKISSVAVVNPQKRLSTEGGEDKSPAKMVKVSEEITANQPLGETNA